MLFTGDATFTRRDLSSKGVALGGDDFLSVREDRPNLKVDTHAAFRPAFSPRA